MSRSQKVALQAVLPDGVVLEFTRESKDNIPTVVLASRNPEVTHWTWWKFYANQGKAEGDMGDLKDSEKHPKLAGYDWQVCPVTRA